MSRSETMFIDVLPKRYPKRVLKSLTLEYYGFTAIFDVARGRTLKLQIHVFSQGDQLDVYEVALGSSKHRYWLNHVYNKKIARVDLLPLLKGWLVTTLGSDENVYEGSFASLILAGVKEQQHETSE